jgi:hypothetical protein
MVKGLKSAPTNIYALCACFHIHNQFAMDAH